MSARHWIFQETLAALLHATFSRGGSVVVRFDDELLQLVWAVARTYVDAASIEHPRSAAVPLYVIPPGEDSSGRKQDPRAEPVD